MVLWLRKQNPDTVYKYKTLMDYIIGLPELNSPRGGMIINFCIFDPIYQKPTDMSLLSKKITELQERTQHALQGGGDKAIAKQIAMGKLPARERIRKLLDEGTFYEYDLFIQHDAREFGMEKKDLAGDGVVIGTGKINGQPVAVYAQDFTVQGGSLGHMHGRKIADLTGGAQ